MDRLNQMRVFVTVVERESFTAAADALGMAKSTVSRQVSDLEARLGARLLYRTTRVLHPTDVGRAYFERCQAILADVAEADASVAERGGAVQGTLHLASGALFASMHLTGPLAAFCRDHPEVRVDLRLDDRFVNLVEEGLDLAVRIIRSPPDSSLVARRLASTRHQLYASRELLARHPVPDLDALRRAPCLVRDPPGPSWRLEGPDGDVEIEVQATMVCNQAEPLVEACRRGLGVALLPDFMTYRLVRAGELVPVLPAYPGWESGVYAIYPHRRLLSGRVRAFIDLLAEAWDPPPWSG